MLAVVSWLRQLYRQLNGAADPGQSQPGTDFVHRPGRLVVRPIARPVVGPVEPLRLLVGPNEPIPVTPSVRAAWDDRGWSRHRQGGGFLYEGFYEVRDRQGRVRRFSGQVWEWRGRLEARIADPPVEIRQHPKGPCFGLIHAPWFVLHWHRGPTCVDEAILYVERILHESLNRGHR